MSPVWKLVAQSVTPAALSRRLAKHPRLATVLRYLLPLVIVAFTVALAHSGPLTNPTSGVLSIVVLMACAFFGGFGPSLLLPPLLLVLSRVYKDPAERWTFKPDEWMAVAIITLITLAFGLAGSYRRRIRTVTRQHERTLRDQARALSRATIAFRDMAGRITQWNAGVEHLFGFTSAAAVGREMHQLLRTEFPQPQDAIEQQLLSTGQWQCEVVQYDRSGNVLHVATHWILYRDLDGKPIGVAEVFNDVTALRRAEAEVREADRRKDEFLAMLGHELRNPLAPIRSGLDILSLEKTNGHQSTVRVMQQQVEHLVRLVDDLLDVSRIMQGRIELRSQSVSLADLVQRSVSSLETMLHSRQQTLHLDLSEEAIWLECDPVRMVQILENLLSNASKYSDTGGQIELSAQLDRGQAVIRVRDEGVGIDANLLPHIFELFTQANRSLDRAQGGLGIGLSLVKKLVELHGGSVSAESAGAGQGCTFTLRFPTTAAPLPTAEKKAELSPAVPRRILVVDDNVAAASLFASLLRQMGDHDVEVAGDGPAALRLLDQMHFEIVFLDIGLPDMDGYQVARQIRRHPRYGSLLLVALTGYGQEDDRRKSREAGFDEHLIKPCGIDDVTEILAHPALNHPSESMVNAARNSDTPFASRPLEECEQQLDGVHARAAFDKDPNNGGPNLRKIKHDLANTLYSLRLAVELLSADGQDAGQSQKIVARGLEEEADRLHQVIETLQMALDGREGVACGSAMDCQGTAAGRG